MVENILAFLFPPSFEGAVTYQTVEDEFEPFSNLNGEDGVGLRMYDVRATGIEKAGFNG